MAGNEQGNVSGPLLEDKINARKPSKTVKRVRQETQQPSRGLNVPHVPHTSGNVRLPLTTTKHKVKKSKTATLLTRLRENHRRESCAKPPTQDVTRQEVQNALNIFEKIRLEVPKSGHKLHPSEVLRKMKQQNSQLVLYSGGKEGPLPGVEEGIKVRFRAQLSLLGIHRHLQKGIDWKEVNSEILAISVVLSGEYEGDTDEGESVIYTGEGGRNPKTGRQIAHQKLEKGNLALYNSYRRQNSIRFVRGQRDANSADGKSYTYDGLYKVKSCKKVTGVSTFQVFKFNLEREPNQRPLQRPLDGSLRLPKRKCKGEKEKDLTYSEVICLSDSQDSEEDDLNGPHEADSAHSEEEEAPDSEEEVDVTASGEEEENNVSKAGEGEADCIIHQDIRQQEECKLSMDIDQGLAAVVNQFSRYDTGGKSGFDSVLGENSGVPREEANIICDSVKQSADRTEEVASGSLLMEEIPDVAKDQEAMNDEKPEDNRAVPWESTGKLTHCPAKLAEFERSPKK